MTTVEVIVPHPGPRLWHRIVIERLRAQGHGVSIVHQAGASRWPASMKAALRLERRLFRRREPGLASILPEITEISSATAPNLRVDLSGVAPNSTMPTIRLAFDRACSDASMIVSIADGRLPEIEAVLDDNRVIGKALPMIDKRESTALGADDVLARAVTLVCSMVERFDGGWRSDAGKARPRIPGTAGDVRFMSAYAGKALPRIGREALRRSRYRHAHWRVGYRFIDGPGIAQTGELGTGWAQIADRGDRFYADPFAFEWQGKPYIFVEDYPHATKKAVISVAEFDAGGVAQTPEPVLEEPFHLSYPQVFHWADEVWMLPEGSAGGGLILYRAAEFPRRWEAHSTLLKGEISDATLLEHQGRWWLFATQRDGHGSTSDTLVVFQAPEPVGPWTPHRLNPVLIDRRMARPGGAFINVAGKLLLPVQDGTLGYGGGLGLAEILELNDENVVLSAPAAISEVGDWPYPQIHTLNRASRLEVIDGIAAVRK